MKMLFVADLFLGLSNTESLDIEQSHKWQRRREEKFENLVDIASQNNVSYITLVGDLFGQERVSESLLDRLFDAIKSDSRLQVLVFLDVSEHRRVSYRNDIPENLHIVCLQNSDSYLDDEVAVRIDDGIIEIQLADNDSITIKKNTDGVYEIFGMQEKCSIPRFEPIGFEDSSDNFFGYGIIEWSEDVIKGYITKANKTYSYRSIELKILPVDDEKEILAKVDNAVRGADSDTFLRVTITGQSAFGLMIDADALKRHLQNRVFFAVVFDNTVMDIDESEFDNDISLRSEFVRLAMQDDSLSESERNRLISYGWNVLSGKGADA